MIKTPAGEFHAKKVSWKKGKRVSAVWLSQEVPGLGIAREDMIDGVQMLPVRIGHGQPSTFPEGVKPKPYPFAPDAPMMKAIATMKAATVETEKKAKAGGVTWDGGAQIPTTDGGTPAPLKTFSFDGGS